MMNDNIDFIKKKIISTKSINAWYPSSKVCVGCCFCFSFGEICIVGYGYAVDWWSLGIVAYEMRAGSRPFVIHSTTPVEDVKDILFTTPSFPRHWNANFIELIRKVSIFILLVLYWAMAYTCLVHIAIQFISLCIACW